MVSPSKAVELTLRGAIQQSEKATMNAGEVGMRVVFRGRCKKIAIGTVKQREQMAKTANSVVGQIGCEAGRQLMRGLFGNLRR